MLFNTIRPTVARSLRFAARRNFHHELYKADEAAAKAFADEASAVEHHAASTATLWFRVSAFLAMPLVAAALIRSYKQESEHIKHLKHAAHEKHEDADVPPEFLYQNIRRKDFFWGNGDETLFWNPLVNKHNT
ncbi:cytochrome c oxidase, subunit VIa [Lipomyces arxii]|uniref:cytochrome c oxidase, subunit VIa n=1 Tax=Lipomyces arxii TaxID=56418 RepID=UPI0034CF4530